MSYLITTENTCQGVRFAYVILQNAIYHIQDGGLDDAGNLLMTLQFLVKYSKVELEEFSWEDD